MDSVKTSIGLGLWTLVCMLILLGELGVIIWIARDPVRAIPDFRKTTIIIVVSWGVGSIVILLLGLLN